MQAARSIVERLTAAVLQPLATLGLTAALATAAVQLLRELRLPIRRD